MAEELYRAEPRDRLGDAAREADAARALQRWRHQRLTTITLVGVFGGLGAAWLAFLLAEAWLTAHVGVQVTRAASFIGILVWVAAIYAAKAVAKRVVIARTPAAVARFAARHQVPAASLVAIARATHDDVFP